MKLGVSAYSYSAMLGRGEVSFLELPRLAAEQGYSAIEFVDFHTDMVPIAGKLRAACAEAGVEISSLAVSGNMLGEDAAAAMEAYKRKIDLAAELGAPVMRHDIAYGGAGKYRTFAGALPYLAEGCRETSEYGATLGVKLAVENHGQFLQESTRVEALYNAVNHPNFGLLVDMGNFLCADEAPETAVGRLAPYAIHVHAKDFFRKQGSPVSGQGWFGTRAGNSLRGTVIGHGVVPVAQCLGVLKAAGYDGTVTVEFEGIEDNRQAVAWCRENMASILAGLR